MKLSAAGLTDIGKRRQVNQDNFFMNSERGLFIVADGMGGHAGGELASKLAVDAVSEHLQNNLSMTHIKTSELILEAFYRANSVIYEHAQQTRELIGMGTTLMTLFFDETTVHMGHVGDSRIYLARPDQLWQLSTDHSLVTEKLKAGIITRDQVKQDKNRNVITPSVGFEVNVQVDLYERDFEQGEIYLMCTDGLSGMLSDEEILEKLTEFQTWQNTKSLDDC